MTESEINDSKVATTATRPALVAAPASVPGGEAFAGDSFGRALAAGRQARGLSQGEVAAQLRLQLRQVRAIETEDLGALPEGPFVRGFVRNYAKLVNVPVEPLLASLNARLQPSEPLRVDGAGAAVSPVQLAAREHASRITVIGGSLLMLVVFAVLGWWTMRPAPTVPAPTAPAVIAAPPAAPAEAAAQAPATAETPAPAPPSEGAAPMPAANGSAPAALTALHFSFHDRSWVEVTQADGKLLMSRTNEAGTRETLQGTPPYNLVVGNASKVELEFRGSTVDLAAIASREDVARLRLE